MQKVTSFLLSSYPVLVVSKRARPQVAGTYRGDDNVVHEGFKCECEFKTSVKIFKTDTQIDKYLIF